ncbi:MAG: hypothetical protein KF734_19505 [Saprospiraceae bacterium]|nr:hypothetical protein [Saprospiraceae bacterium]
MKKHHVLLSILALTTLLISIPSCTKNDLSDTPDITVKDEPNIPEGNRVTIHFGTSTLRGCMYSFSNCIWISWDKDVLKSNQSLAFQFGNGEAASQYFGQYFPVTSDYVVTKEEAEALGIESQVIPAGFYPIRNALSGLPTGKRTVVFSPDSCQPVAGLVNPNNPQDNIGQLHNLAVQVVLNDNRDAIEALNGDRKAIQNLLLDKTAQFLADAELPVSAAEQQRARSLNLNRDYSDYAARLNETRLTANDKKLLLEIFDEAAATPVGSPQELSEFVKRITDRETYLARQAKLDNPKVVLSMVSVLKYSRYYWYWKAVSSPENGGGTSTASIIPDWVWADIIGMELGGPLVSAAASAYVYHDKK